MPLYEYECLKCGHRFERIRKFSDRPVTACPQCKKGKVKQLLSASSFHLKGSGWYATDYGGRDKGKSETTSEHAEEPAAKSKEPEKTEKKDKTEKKEQKATEKKKEPAAKN